MNDPMAAVADAMAERHASLLDLALRLHGASEDGPIQAFAMERDDEGAKYYLDGKLILAISHLEFRSSQDGGRLVSSSRLYPTESRRTQSPLNGPNPNAQEDCAQWEARNPDLAKALKERHQQQIAEAIKNNAQPPNPPKGMTYTGWRNLHDLSPIYEPTTPTEAKDNAPPQRFQGIEASEQREVQRQLLRRIDTLEAELERERLRLTVCGVAAKADTPESAARARNCHPDYCSASLDDVIDMVDKLMEARARLKEQEPINSVRAIRAMVDQVVPHEEVPHEDWPPLELERLRQRQRTRAELLAITEELATPKDTMDDYITLLISVVFLEPCVGVKRFSVGIPLNDPLMAGLELAEWREPRNKERLLSLLADDWFADDCEIAGIVGCEQIDGSIQWNPMD